MIINIVVRRHDLLELIISDRNSLFTSNFWSLLCYFLGIKRRLSKAFYHQIDDQIERQNSTMEAYFQVFVY